MTQSEFNRKIIKSLIRKHLNDYVGWNSNSYSDTGETWCDASVKDCEDYIYNEIINSTAKYQVAENGMALETRHIRFEGKAWIKDVIKTMVAKDYADGWDFPHSK